MAHELYATVSHIHKDVSSVAIQDHAAVAVVCIALFLPYAYSSVSNVNSAKRYSSHATVKPQLISGPPSPEDCFHRFHHATAILITTLLRKMRDSKYPQGVYGYVLPVCPFMASFLFAAVAWGAAPTSSRT